MEEVFPEGAERNPQAVSRRRAEAEFADREYAPYVGIDLRMNPEIFRSYAKPRPLPVDWREWAARWLGNMRGQRMLDLGCGMGEEAVYFAKLGAQVIAVDISATGLDLARRRAIANGVGDRVGTAMMVGERLAVRSRSVDLVHGLGILHHLPLFAVLPEVRRVLREGGRAVFLEPVDFTRFIPTLKEWLPGHRIPTTSFERHLSAADLEVIRGVFPQCQIREFFVLARLRKLLPPRVGEWLKWIDCFLIPRSELARRCASGVVIQVQV